MKNTLTISLIAGLFLFTQSGLLAQDKALKKQDNKVYPVAKHTGAKIVYMPVKTKSEIAAERVQKREKAQAIELQKKPERLMEKTAVSKTMKHQDLIMEKEKAVKMSGLDQSSADIQKQKQLTGEKKLQSNNEVRKQTLKKSAPVEKKELNYKAKEKQYQKK